MAPQKELQTAHLTQVTNVLTSWADQFSTTYKNKLSAIRASGQLEETPTFKLQLNKEEWEIQLNLQNYWTYIENGRKPGTSPPHKCHNQLHTNQAHHSTTLHPSGRKKTILTENQLAFLIGRKIKEQGIPAKPLLRQTSSELRPALTEELTKALHTDLSQHIHTLLNS